MCLQLQLLSEKCFDEQSDPLPFGGCEATALKGLDGSGIHALRLYRQPAESTTLQLQLHSSATNQKKRCDYRDLGGDYFDRLNADGLKRYLVRRLEALGHKVTIEAAGNAAPEETKPNCVSSRIYTRTVQAA